LTYQNKNALDYWSKWGKKVWLWPSIDEIDERAELIRSGTSWKNVEANLRAVSEINIHVRPSITVSCMNVHRIPVILDRLIDIGVIKQEEENWTNFSINVVEYSPRFHVSALKDETRVKIKQQLEEYIGNYKIRFGVDIRPQFLHLFWHLEKPHNEENAKQFKENSLLLDSIRKEDTLKTIPEIAELFE
jgi:MoaA/NifB/PqqE/SkfB family radical SAM enzyme